jgi:hypothetical protein
VNVSRRYRGIALSFGAADDGQEQIIFFGPISFETHI